jgi:hypothetical protein
MQLRRLSEKLHVATVENKNGFQSKSPNGLIQKAQKTNAGSEPSGDKTRRET